MDKNLAMFLVITVAISAALVLMMFNSWMRTRRRVAEVNAEAGLGLVGGENDRLRETVARLEQRLAVLETIAIDPAERTAREIEALRSN
jgi:hypothetical protein